MRKVTTAVTQMACSWDREKTLNTAEHLVRSAAEKGANIVLLQELFETPYFCQSHNFAYFNLAKTVEENTAINQFKILAKITRYISILELIYTYKKRRRLNHDKELRRKHSKGTCKRPQRIQKDVLHRSG